MDREDESQQKGSNLEQKAADMGISVHLARDLIGYDAVNSPEIECLSAATPKRLDLLRWLYGQEVGALPEFVDGVQVRGPELTADGFTEEQESWKEPVVRDYTEKQRLEDEMFREQQERDIPYSRDSMEPDLGAEGDS